MDGEERTNSGRRRSVTFLLPQSKSALPQAQQHHAGFALLQQQPPQQQQQQPTFVVSAYEAAAAAAVYQARMLEQNRQLHLLVQERNQILLREQQQHKQEENQIQVLEKQVRQLQLQLNHELRKKTVVAQDTTRRPRRNSVGERMRLGERRRSNCTTTTATGGKRQSSTTTTRTENPRRLSCSSNGMYRTSLSKSMSSMEEAAAAAAAAAADAYETSDDDNAEDYESHALERRSSSSKAGARQEPRRIRRVCSSDCLRSSSNRDRSPASHRRGSLRPHTMPQRRGSQTNSCSSNNNNKKKKPEQRAGQVSSERRLSLGRRESDPCADSEMGGEYSRRKASTRRSSLQDKRYPDRRQQQRSGDFMFRRKLRDGKILAARVVTAESGDPYMSHLIQKTLQGGSSGQQVSTSSVFRIGEASRGLPTTVLAFSTDDAIDISRGVKRVVFHLKHVRGGTFTKEEFGDMRVSEVLDLSSVRPLVVDIMTEKC